MSKQLKSNSDALKTASANINSAANTVADTQGKLSSQLMNGAISDGKYAFQKVVHDVLQDIIKRIPSDVAEVVRSYANGLLHLDEIVIGAEDQNLAVMPAEPGGPLQGAPTPIQGGSPSLQGSGIPLQAAGGAALLTGGAVLATGSKNNGGGGAARQNPAPAPTPTTTSYANEAQARSAYEAAAGLHPSSAEWAQGSPANGQADEWNKAANNCTSWAAFRRTEMGLTVPDGNGSQMASNAGLIPSQQVHAGSLVSYGTGFGHVMVVEKVLSGDPPHFIVSEMNYDYNGSISVSTDLVQNADGSWTKTIPGHAPIKIAAPEFCA